MGLSTVDAFKHMSNLGGAVVVEGETLKRLQLVLESMLEDIDTVCTENQIDYQLGGGSCLGAIRHGGFIPWDDDIDINMPRAHYVRFKDAFLQRFGNKYWVHDATTSGYGWGAPRIRKKGTVVRGKGDLGLDECGAWIDLCIIENAPDNRLLRYLHGLGSLALGLMVSCSNFARFSDEYLKLVATDSSNRRVFKAKIIIGRLVSFISIDTWTILWDRWNGLCKNNSTEYITIPTGRKHYFGEINRRDTLFPSRRHVFASTHSFVPNDADEYLKTLYGDGYMVPPPEDKRETHVVYELNLPSDQALQDMEA